MSKDNPTASGHQDNSPMLALMKEIKADILNQVKATEEAMKAELRTSLEATNQKVSKLTNTVVEHSGKIAAIEKWIVDSESKGKEKPTYADALKSHSKSESKENDGSKVKKLRKDDDIDDETEKIRSIFKRAKHIVGLEPITDDDIKDHFQDTKDKENDEY